MFPCVLRRVALQVRWALRGQEHVLRPWCLLKFTVAGWLYSAVRRSLTPWVPYGGVTHGLVTIWPKICLMSSHGCMFQAHPCGAGVCSAGALLGSRSLAAPPSITSHSSNTHCPPQTLVVHNVIELSFLPWYKIINSSLPSLVESKVTHYSID